MSPKTFSIRVLGTEGVVDYMTDMSVWPQAERMDAATTLTLTTREGRRELPFAARDMLVEELEEFACAARGEAEPETGGEEALAALALVLAAVESDAAGEAVDLRTEQARRG